MGSDLGGERRRGFRRAGGRGAVCTIPGPDDPTMKPLDDFNGNFDRSQQGDLRADPVQRARGDDRASGSATATTSHSGQHPRRRRLRAAPRRRHRVRAGRAAGLERQRGQGPGDRRERVLAPESTATGGDTQGLRAADTRPGPTRPARSRPAAGRPSSASPRSSARRTTRTASTGVSASRRAPMPGDGRTHPYSSVSVRRHRGGERPRLVFGRRPRARRGGARQLADATSFDFAFAPLSAGGAGLDFVGLVDHNNNINRGEIGRYQGDYPGKLIIPGTEVTTYKGHYNNIGSSTFADFRGGPVYQHDRQRVPRKGPGRGSRRLADPADPVDRRLDAGQPPDDSVERPEQVSLCRGCPWDYTDAETDYSKVDAIEVQNGAADFGPPSARRSEPVHATAIAFYEPRSRPAPTSPRSGRATPTRRTSRRHDGPDRPARRRSSARPTSPSARSSQGIKRRPHLREAVRQRRSRHPRHRPGAPGASDAIIGDTLTGPSAAFDVEVMHAGATAARAGSLRACGCSSDGDAVDSTPVTSDDFTHTFASSGAARYSIEVVRLDPCGDRVEVYSSPVWFEPGKSVQGRQPSATSGRARRSSTVRACRARAQLSLDAKGVKTRARRPRRRPG